MNPPTPQMNRRTLVRTAAWSVPAVTAVSMSPAFAASTTPEGGAACVPATVVAVGWKVVSGSIAASGNTGWQKGTVSAGGVVPTGAFISASQERWFTQEPAGTFISYANNASTSIPAVLEVTYDFSVSGTATLHLANTLKLGYGDPNSRTERQTLEVVIKDGDSEQIVSRIGHQRLAGTVQRPTTSTESVLARREADLLAAGYTLHPLGNASRTPASIPGEPVVVSAVDTTARIVSVVYRITLDRRLPGTLNETVNDDLILNAPTIQSC